MENELNNVKENDHY